MADEELNTENEEDLWAAAAEDLSQQREMLRKAADDKTGDTDPPPTSAVADAPSAPAQDGQNAPAPPPVAAVAPVELSTPTEMDRILDIPLKISVELGRTRMLINDLLQLGQGSVIELSKLVGEPLEVLVNERLVAKGEVVVINEKFGVRLTEVMSPNERIQQLA